MTVLRAEAKADHQAVRQLNCQAFGGAVEAAIVEKLRGGIGVISLVAVDGERVVGHLLLTPVEIVGPAVRAKAAGLGPMAVAPDRQGRGIGSKLVQRGLDECRRKGYESVVVVGHATYYPRFGFRRASAFGLRCQFEVPDDVFMALELLPGALAEGGGLVRYAAAFSEE